MVTVLGFGVGATGAHSFKMNMARRNFRAGSPHLNQVRKEDTIDSMLSLPHIGLACLPKQFFIIFFARGVPIELKTKRTDLFEGNTLVHSVRHALTRRSRLKKKKKQMLQTSSTVAKLLPMWPHYQGQNISDPTNHGTAVSLKYVSPGTSQLCANFR